MFSLVELMRGECDAIARRHLALLLPSFEFVSGLSFVSRVRANLAFILLTIFAVHLPGLWTDGQGCSQALLTELFSSGMRIFCCTTKVNMLIDISVGIRFLTQYFQLGVQD